MKPNVIWADEYVLERERNISREELLANARLIAQEDARRVAEPRPDLALLHAQGQLPWPDQHRKIVIRRRPFAALRHRLQRQLAPQWKELAAGISERLARGQAGGPQEKTALQLLHEKWLLEHPEETS